MATAATTETLLQDFVASTGELVEHLAELDPTRLDGALKRQLAAFEALESAVSAGLVLRAPDLAAAIEQGRRALVDAQNRMNEIQSELVQLRSTRSRTSRHRIPEATAQFVSRRV